MTDIVERLRGIHVTRHPSRSVVQCEVITILEAAAEIARLRAALRAALRFIDANVAHPDTTDEMAKAWGELWDTNPRAMLGEKP